jgi:hypothetical protein
MSEPGERQLVLVVGVGRSGTSLLSGILGQLGFHIPQPEVKADDTNPRGFGEPRWAVDFHTRLLRERRVTVNDARPAAWTSTHAAAGDAKVHGELSRWLEGQFREAQSLVVKDPRTVWFLPLWTRSAAELGVPTSFVTMLRHPAEIVMSARKSYGPGLTTAGRSCAWINVILQTELATRGARRAFVRYEDLLADWTPEIRRVGTLLGSPELAGVQPGDHPEVDRFVDPALHRSRVGWDELDVPARVRDLAEDVWAEVQGLVRPEGDGAEAATRLDAARAAYAALYAEAESIAQSSVMAAKARRGGAKSASAPAGPPSLRVRIARRIPVRYRRRLRRALRTLRARS